MESIAVDLLTRQGNWAVVRLPARQFPGVVMQGDSLAILCDELRRALASIGAGEHADAGDQLGVVLERLESVKAGYEAALAAHSIPLPY